MLDFSVTFAITLVNITVLTLILRAILFKPVTKFMADRAKRIQDSIEASQKDKVQAEAMRAQYMAQLENAESEAGAIIREARELAEAEATKILAEGRAAAEESFRAAKKQLETERAAALTLFRKEAAELVVSAAGRLVGREMRKDDNYQYADMLLSEAEHGAAGRNSGGASARGDARFGNEGQS